MDELDITEDDLLELWEILNNSPIDVTISAGLAGKLFRAGRNELKRREMPTQSQEERMLWALLSAAHDRRKASE